MSSEASLPSLEQFRLFDPATIAEPYEFYKTLHREAPVWRDPESGTYVVSRQDEVRQVAMNPELFSHRINEWLRAADATWRELDEVYASKGWTRVDTLAMSDPPRHARYRSMVQRWFTPAKMAEAVPHVKAVVDELLDDLACRSACDFNAAFSVPMPIRVFAIQLGVPREEMELFKRFGDADIEAIGLVASRERQLELAEIGLEEQRYFARKIKHYRKSPAALLISDLANARDDDGALFSIEELLSMINILVLGGTETTTNALSIAMWLLCRSPGLEKELRADSRLLEAFIEESLRFQSPVHALFRIATQDVELGGVAIPKGARVLINFAAANRDEARFSTADRFDPRRSNVQQHMAFGTGIKRCIGAPLARLELRSAFESILARMRDIRLADPGFVPEFVPNAITRGMRSLPIAYASQG